jgi:superfamily I DNA/RNA helicase
MQVGISWLGAANGGEIDRRRVGRVYRQSPRLRELAASLSTRRDEGAEGPWASGPEEAADVWPLLAERHTGGRLADWLADRITEVERAVGRLPSIAIFVDGEERIDPLVGLVRPRLEERNIRIVPCKDGRVVGDRQEVRVFDVQHIKGLEFEGVFFVGIDRLAERLPELFDRYFYVGVSRAATYLGVTCNAALPERLEEVRRYFGQGDWL